MKVILGLLLGAGLALGAIFLFDQAEPPQTSLVVAPETPEVDQSEQADVGGQSTKPTHDVTADTLGEQAQDVVEEGAAAVADVAETIETDMKDALSGADDTVDNGVQSITNQGGAVVDGTSNTVKRALDNVLGGASGDSGAITPPADIDAAANLEHDAITGDTRPELKKALTVEGFDGLAIRQALVTADVGSEISAKVTELLIIGENNPEQLQVVMPQIRALLGF